MKLERSLLVNTLIVVLALGSGAALFITRERPSTSERAERENNLLSRFPRADLRRVAVKSEQGSFTLERVAADAGAPAWQLRSDASATDAEATEGLLRSLEMGGFLRKFTETDSDTQLGFDKPKLELMLSFGFGDVLIRVGKPAATPADASYIEIRDGTDRRVGVVRKDWLNGIPRTGDALRPRALLPYALSDIERVRIELGRDVAPLNLKRGPGPSWQDANQHNVRRDSVENLIFELGAVKVEHFLESKDANALLERAAAVSVQLEPSNKRAPLTFRIGAICPRDEAQSVLVRTSPTALAACVPRGAQALFSLVAERLNDTAAFTLHTDEVESARLEQGGKALEFARTERGFQLRSPSVSELSLELGNQRLKELTSLEGELLERPELAALGLALPQGFVHLRSAAIERDPKYTEKLELGRVQGDGRLPVRRAGDGAVLMLSRDAARSLNPSALLLRSLTLFDFGPSELRELSLHCGGQTQRLERDGGGNYRLLEPAGFDHDGALALELIQQLGTLRAQRWVSDTDETAFGLSAARVRATLSLADKTGGKPRQVSLLLGAETSGGVYAKLDDTQGVFVLPRSLAQSLCTLLISRDFGLIPAAKLARIELLAGSRSVVLQRRGDEFVPQSNLPESSVVRLLSAIENLRAEVALSVETTTLTPQTLSLQLQPLPGQGKPQRLLIGTALTHDDAKVFAAQVEGRAVRYALPERSVRELLDAL